MTHISNISKKINSTLIQNFQFLSMMTKNFSSTIDNRYNMRPQEVFPTSTEVRTDPEKWNKRSITYYGEKRYFDQDVRTGKCYFCHLYGRTQKYYKQTYIHHLDYDDDDPLMWTLELCSGCHYRLDKNNRKQVDKHYPRRDKTDNLIKEHERFVAAEFKRLGL